MAWRAAPTWQVAQYDDAQAYGHLSKHAGLPLPAAASGFGAGVHGGGALHHEGVPAGQEEPRDQRGLHLARVDEVEAPQVSPGDGGAGDQTEPLLRDGEQLRFEAERETRENDERGRGRPQTVR
ncbi:hypothetical protein GCM10010129_73010 [Streptomyces fumigatiscleroticus]|nr:hypothetical protein GCM10010129_73010 [Streptomyces fumigatiscleroticus]